MRTSGPKTRRASSSSPAAERSQSRRGRGGEGAAEGNVALTAWTPVPQVQDLEKLLHDTRLSWIEQQEKGRMFAALSISRVSACPLFTRH